MTDSMGHDLTRNDPADLPRCPMEALADRINNCPKPKFLECGCAARLPTGEVMFSLIGTFYSPDSIEDLINYLARVKG